MNVIHGDCLLEMAKMESNSIDFIFTDPPYGLKFMSKKWDYQVPSIEIWKEALRVLKPGGMAAIFGGSRTYHRMTTNVEDAGFKIRDCIMWIYGSGFPKSHNHFGLEGYGTALKPAHEPILLAMKPLEGTYAQNVEKWGIGGINIDDSRISGEKPECKNTSFKAWRKLEGRKDIQDANQTYDSSIGRWPANIILDEEAGKILDEQSGYSVNLPRKKKLEGPSGWKNSSQLPAFSLHNDSGGASRFFYCAKASNSERNAGLEGMPLKQTMGGGGLNNTDDDVCGKYGSIKAIQQNSHPTVKPISLIKYIIKLLAPPNNPILLDPFCGSGSTLIAAQELGIKAIGIEKEKEYCEISRKRIEYVIKKNGEICHDLKSR